MCSWDDHEVYNNYAGSMDANRRRDSAYQAYYEHMPLRPSRVLKGQEWRNISLYGRISYGDLAQLCVLDTRQFRTDQPCASSLDNCQERLAPSQTLTGGKQEEDLKMWLTPSSADGSTGHTWNVVCNQVLMMQYDHTAGSGESYYMDGWDGYVAHRDRFFEHLADARVPNVVAVTGHMHAGFAGELKAKFKDETSALWDTSFWAPRSAPGSPISGETRGLRAHFKTST